MPSAQFLHAEMPPHMLAHALNGTLVGLLAAPRGDAQPSGGADGLGACQGSQPEPDAEPMQGGAPGGGERVGADGAAWEGGLVLGLGSEHARPQHACIGVGLVRAVDAAARRIYLLTPVRGDAIERVTTLQARLPPLPRVSAWSSERVAVKNGALCPGTAFARLIEGDLVGASRPGPSLHSMVNAAKAAAEVCPRRASRRGRVDPDASPECGPGRWAAWSCRRSCCRAAGSRRPTLALAPSPRPAPAPARSRAATTCCAPRRPGEGRRGVGRSPKPFWATCARCARQAGESASVFPGLRWHPKAHACWHACHEPAVITVRMQVWLMCRDLTTAAVCK